MDEKTGERTYETTTRRETDKKCPRCGGTMDFNPETGGLLCPYCEYKQGIEGEETAQELDFGAAENKESCDWGAEKKTVTCKSCGAVSVYDALQLSDECPYCGSNQVMEEKGVNTLAPGGVVPFKLTARQAGEKFTAWIKRKLFCPRRAKKQARPERFKGLYLPYWSFDTDTSTQYIGRYGIDRTTTDSKGNVRTTTDWYATSGRYDCFVDDQIVLASDRHDAGILRGVEPFGTGQSLSYKPEYVAGFVAERYSVGLKAAWEKAKQLISGMLEDAIEKTIRRQHGADKAQVTSMSTFYSGVKYKYLLLPVWLSSFCYKGRSYSFYVNGETGRVAGKTPVSALRVAIACLIGAALAALVIWIFMNHAG